MLALMNARLLPMLTLYHLCQMQRTLVFPAPLFSSALALCDLLQIFYPTHLLSRPQPPQPPSERPPLPLVCVVVSDLLPSYPSLFAILYSWKVVSLSCHSSAGATALPLYLCLWAYLNVSLRSGSD